VFGGGLSVSRRMSGAGLCYIVSGAGTRGKGTAATPPCIILMDEEAQRDVADRWHRGRRISVSF
jgi:hypothetical protein